MQPWHPEWFRLVAYLEYSRRTDSRFWYTHAFSSPDTRSTSGHLSARSPDRRIILGGSVNSDLGVADK